MKILMIIGIGAAIYWLGAVIWEIFRKDDQGDWPDGGSA